MKVLDLRVGSQLQGPTPHGLAALSLVCRQLLPQGLLVRPAHPLLLHPPSVVSIHPGFPSPHPPTWDVAYIASSVFERALTCI